MVNIRILSLVTSSLNSEDEYDPHSDRYKFNVKHRHPILCQSERVLKDYSEVSQSLNTQIEEAKKKSKEILAARQSRNWKDFVNQSYKYTPFTKEGKQKRLDRMLMVSDAMDAFDEIPDVPMYNGDEPRKGRQFLKNDWSMGPFYSYDFNYLNK